MLTTPIELLGVILSWDSGGDFYLLVDRNRVANGGCCEALGGFLQYICNEWGGADVKLAVENVPFIDAIIFIFLSDNGCGPFKTVCIHRGKLRWHCII